MKGNQEYIPNDGTSGGKERDVLGPPIPLVSDYAHNPRTKNQGFPVSLLSHAWHLVTPDARQPCTVVIADTWSFLSSEGAKTHHFPGVPLPLNPVISWWRTNFGFLKLLRISQWIGPGMAEGSTENVVLIGDNGQSLSLWNFPNSLTSFKASLPSHLFMGSTRNNSVEICIHSSSLASTPPFPFPSAITCIHIEDPIKSMCLFCLLLMSFFYHWL